MYGLGCSLVHFSLLVTIFAVRTANVYKAKQFDEQYREEILQECLKRNSPEVNQEKFYDDLHLYKRDFPCTKVAKEGYITVYTMRGEDFQSC